jgi:hypothetical protein
MYLELSVAMRNLWCLEKISILPLIISATGIVLWRTINLGRQISDISKKSMQATIYCHYD